MTTENTTSFSHKDLFLTQKFLFDSCGFQCSTPETEAESADYNAHTFKVNDKSIVYREAKITPTKVGQFVTIWKRTEKVPSPLFIWMIRLTSSLFPPEKTIILDILFSRKQY